MATEINETFYELHGDGSLSRVSISKTPCGSTLQVASALAAASVFKFRDPAWPEGVTAGISKGAIQLAICIPNLMLSTHWAPAQDAGGDLFLTPVWQGGVVGAVAADLEWTPPSGVDIILFVALPDVLDDIPTFRLAFKQGEDLRLPPLPNVYPDGRVCTGSSIDNWHGFRTTNPSITDIVAWSKDLLARAPWNTDLLDDAKKRITRDLIRLSTAVPPEMLPYAGSGEPLSACARLSGPAFDWIGGAA